MTAILEMPQARSRETRKWQVEPEIKDVVVRVWKEEETMKTNFFINFIHENSQMAQITQNDQN